jgi:sulfonate transport system permease protein
VDRKLVEVARIYNLSSAAIARRVILPATLPSLFTGLRLGFSQAWLFVVVAEIFGGQAGLGFELTNSLQMTRVDIMLVSVAVLAILGKITDTIIVRIERRVLRWRDTLATESVL